jgi:RNA polymerase sigma-70 factor (ECF subfamily)
MSPLETAVAANADDLLAYLQRRLANREDAADALSDVLLAAWRHRSKLPAEPTEARMWLFGIASKTLLNSRRSGRRRSLGVDTLRAAIRTASAMPAAADVDAALDVRAAVAALPPRQAELVRLVHWDGFCLAEAAAVLGITASTARSHYAAARERLRTALDSCAPHVRDVAVTVE